MYPIRIPFDISNLIISYVSSTSQNSQKDLQACALTCKEFLEPARRHFFRTVTFSRMTFDRLEVLNLPKRLQRFTEALESSPEIALYVRILCIQNHNAESLIFDQPTFPRMLSMLSNLESFDLAFIDRHACNWKTFSLELRQALVTVCASTTLFNMSLVGISNLPPMLMKWLAPIPTLQLTSTHFSTDQQQEEIFLQKPAITSQYRIRKSLMLCVVDCDDSNLLMNGLLPQNSQIERLDLRIASEIPLAFSTEGKCRISLTALSLPYTLSQDDLQKFDISSLPHLRRLEFWTYQAEQESFETGRSILGKVNDGNILQEIAIRFLGTSTMNLTDTDTDNWEILDGILSSSPFTQLKKVYLSDVYLEEAHNLELMDAWVADNFPALHKKGMMDWIWIKRGEILI
ncbi:hypothetical protein BDQ17DRAFT_1425770 [Cyathus striatus]|nr:hypothetical protein BDQ17DRAFT_1425770 [Cyathus striatus]